jgi:hypothetical protein
VLPPARSVHVCCVDEFKCCGALGGAASLWWVASTEAAGWPEANKRRKLALTPGYVNNQDPLCKESFGRARVATVSSTAEDGRIPPFRR